MSSNNNETLDRETFKFILEKVRSDPKWDPLFDSDPKWLPLLPLVDMRSFIELASLTSEESSEKGAKELRTLFGDERFYSKEENIIINSEEEPYASVADTDITDNISHSVREMDAWVRTNLFECRNHLYSSKYNAPISSCKMRNHWRLDILTLQDEENHFCKNYVIAARFI